MEAAEAGRASFDIKQQAEKPSRLTTALLDARLDETSDIETCLAGLNGERVPENWSYHQEGPASSAHQPRFLG